MSKKQIYMRLTGHHAVDTNRRLKDYPFRVELYNLIKQNIDADVYMIGDNPTYKMWSNQRIENTDMNKPVYGDMIVDSMSYPDLLELISECDVWVAIDSFFSHAAGLIRKRGVEILGPWKKENVGYPWNINLEMNREFQIAHCKLMDDEPQRPIEAFPSPEVVLNAIKTILEEKNV